MWQLRNVVRRKTSAKHCRQYANLRSNMSSKEAVYMRTIDQKSVLTKAALIQVPGYTHKCTGAYVIYISTFVNQLSTLYIAETDV